MADEGYAIAYSFYQSGKYAEAITHFRQLITLNIRQPKAWLGLGAALQMSKKYKEATSAYAVAAYLNQKNPYPHLYAAECYFAQKEVDQGLLALEAAEQLTAKQEEHAPLNDRITAMKKTWSSLAKTENNSWD